MKSKYLPLLAVSLLLIFSAGCKKEEESPDLRNTSGVLDKQYYFRAVIDSVPQVIEFDMKTDEFSIAFTDRTIFHDSYKCVGPGTTLGRKVASVRQPAAAFRNICFSETETSGEEMFYRVFEPDTYPYYQYWSKDSTENYSSSGVLISWLDAGGKVWSSMYGPQENSSFIIRSRESISGPEGEIQLEAIAEFECTLYSEQGDSIQLTKGEYYLPFEKLFQ